MDPNSQTLKCMMGTMLEHSQGSLHKRRSTAFTQFKTQMALTCLQQTDFLNYLVPIP